jgi:ABC-type sugar transport system substrate-binding protein
VRVIRVVVAALLLASAVVFAACGDKGGSGKGNGSTGKKTGSITTVLPGRQIPYYLDLAAGMDAEAKRLGWKLTQNFGTQEVSKEIDQVQNAITTRPDGMVLAPIDQNALIPAYRQAFNQKIPIVTVSDNIGPSGEQYHLSYVGTVYRQTGQRKAKWIADQLHGKGTVAIIHAIRGGNFTEEQGRGAVEEFKKYPGITVIDGPYVGDFTAPAGLQGTQNVLTAHPNVNALYYDNDDIAEGGVQAVKQRGIPLNKVLIVGTDGGAPAIAAVKRGEIDFTVSLCGYSQGVRAIQVLVDYIKNGTKPPKTVVTRNETFTPQDVNQKLAALKNQPKCTRAY